MSHSAVLTPALTITLSVLAGCGETTTPSRPEAVREPSPASSSLVALPNTWTAKANAPDWPDNDLREIPVIGRVGAAAGLAKNAAGRTTLYLFGGLSDDWEHAWGSNAYDVASNTWTWTDYLFYAYSNGVGTIANKMYLTGGYDLEYPVVDPSQIKSRLYVIDPAAGNFIRKRDMPRATASGVTGVINGKLYVLAGTCLSPGRLVVCRNFYRYNPATNTWITLPSAPHAHRGGAGGVINGKFYVAGGGSGVAGGPGTSHQLDVYDPVANVWRTRAMMPEPHAGAGAVLGGKLYVIDGYWASTLAYDPVMNTWRKRASLNVDREELAAVSLSNRILAVVGGNTGYRANEMYTP